jgi:hypothetical protein
MATSSIHKDFVIQDPKVQAMFLEEINRPSEKRKKKHYLEEGERLFKQYFSR